jgi:hypothetical protein
VFDASHPFTFFDYFRVPYQVRPLSSEPGTTSSRAPVHQLRVAEEKDAARGSLFWTDARPQGRAAPDTYRSGRFTLHGSTLVGRVLLDEAVPASLPDLGSAWQPAERILDPSGGHISAIWRDSAGNVFLPFDPGEVMQNFWSESYRELGRSALSAICHSAAVRGYYVIRPALPRALQLRMRRIFTRVQSRSSFPAWPIEDSLHDFYSWLFALVTDLADRPVPYIDPWPDGKSWAFVLTHDVETDIGLAEMDLLRVPERERGYRSSWNLVGERYDVDDDTVRALQREGCEVGVHGLRHDGRDVASRRMVERRLPAMRKYAERWNAVGFRSPATQRGWDLMPMLGFAYDSSYSDTDPYEPQPGGCCTYLPYRNEGMVELPITMPQDHTLFTILQHADGAVWIQKAEHIRDRHGMVLILTHPDYARDPRLAEGYERLLDTFQADESAWHALAKDVAAWWQQRAESTVRSDGEGWVVEGPAASRGRVRLVRPDAAHQRVGGSPMPIA